MYNNVAKYGYVALKWEAEDRQRWSYVKGIGLLEEEDVWVYHYAQLSYTEQHRTVLMIVRIIFQAVIIA